MSESKLTLKEAREKDKLDEFIKEHEDDACGDANKLEKTLKDIAQGENRGKSDDSKST